MPNVAFADIAHREHAIHQCPRIIQHQPRLIDGCLTGAELYLQPEPP